MRENRGLDRGQTDRMTNNIINANIKLVDENSYLKKDNEKLVLIFKMIKEYLNSKDFEYTDKSEIKEKMLEIIER